MGDFVEEIVDSPRFPAKHTKTISFFWDIKNFRNYLKQVNPKIGSLIIQQNEVEKYTWSLSARLRLKANKKDKTEESLGIYLGLKTDSFPVSTSFTVELLDSQRKPWNSVSGKKVFDKEGICYGWDKFELIESLINPANKLLEDGALKFRCEISIPAKEKIIRHLNDYLVSFADMLESSILTDVSLETSTEIIKAHKSVLSCRSSVFKAMFQSEMAESINNVVKIIDFEFEVVKGMLQYIYSGKIRQELIREKASEFLQIADKYDIEGLKEDAVEILGSSFSIQNVAEILVIADLYNALDLKVKAVNFFNKNKKVAIKTEGYKKMLASHKHIFVDLYEAIVRE